MARLTKAQKAAKAAEAAKDDPVQQQDQNKGAGDKTQNTTTGATSAENTVEADKANTTEGEKPKAPKAKADAKFTTVVVIGPKQGRWRIGRHFGPDQTSIPLEDLSEDDKQALHDDPVLEISII